MLTLVLADAELEIVPASIARHPQVLQAARQARVPPTRMLLDSSLHHAAMREIQDGSRRGRPDLVHFFLLTALESIPNQRDALRIIVHTRNNEAIEIDPKTRLVRNYNRFCGLIQQLFENGRVGTPEPLLRLEKNRTLPTILESVKAERILVCEVGGAVREPSTLFKEEDARRDVVCMIGGFPSGDYRSPVPAEAEKVTIFPKPLAVWTVAAEVLAHYPGAARSVAR